MADITEIITEWQAENTPGGLSVMYFGPGVNVPVVRGAIDQMYTDVAARLDSLTTWNVRTSGKIIDEATGTLTGFWESAAVANGVGTLSGTPVANAAQVLLRWRTLGIVNGRLVQGRTFVPGLGSSSVDGGQLSAAAQGAFTTAAATFITTCADTFGVWHRPSDAGPGSWHEVISGATWSELAVQRRRR